MKLKKVDVLLTLVLFAVASELTAIDVEGMYRSEEIGALFMVREIGAGIHTIDLFHIDESISIGTAKRRSEGEYLIKGNPDVTMRFSGDTCALSPVDRPEEEVYERWLGHGGKIDGAYRMPVDAMEVAFVLTVEETEDGISVELEILDPSDLWIAEKSDADRIVVDEDGDRIEFAFGRDSCDVSADGETFTFVKDPRFPAYEASAFVPASYESVPGLYRENVDGEGMLVAVSETGGGIFEFRFFDHLEYADLGPGTPVVDGDTRVVDAGELTFVFGDRRLELAFETEDERMVLEKVTNHDGDFGLYFYENLENGVAMTMDVRKDGSLYELVGDLFEYRQSYRRKAYAENVYMFGKGASRAMLSIGTEVVSFLTGDGEIPLERVGSFAPVGSGSEN